MIIKNVHTTIVCFKLLIGIYATRPVNRRLETLCRGMYPFNDHIKIISDNSIEKLITDVTISTGCVSTADRS